MWVINFAITITRVFRTRIFAMSPIINDKLLKTETVYGHKETWQ